MSQKFHGFEERRLSGQNTTPATTFFWGLGAEVCEPFSKLSCCWMTCNLTTSPLQCKVLICLSHLQSPFTWISLHWRKGAQFPKNRCPVLFKAFGSLRRPHGAGGYWTGLAEGSWSSRCWRPAGIPQSISDGIGHQCLGK